VSIIENNNLNIALGSSACLLYDSHETQKYTVRVNRVADRISTRHCH